MLAKLHHVEMNVIDVGVDADFDGVEGLLDCKVRKGTRNMLREAAMSDAELAQALEVGFRMATEAKAKGHTLLAVGEMGIGNTTAASAITCGLTGQACLHLSLAKVLAWTRVLWRTNNRIIEAVVQKHFVSCWNSVRSPIRSMYCVVLVGWRLPR